MSFNTFLTGRRANVHEQERFNPEQQQALQQALQMAMGGMQDPRKGFAPIAQNAMDRFKTDIAPSIAERFTAMGQGGHRSSAFQGAMGDAASQLMGNLGQQEAQYGLQNQSQLQQMLGIGLAPMHEDTFMPETTGFMGGVAQGLGQAIPAALTGGWSALPGWLASLVKAFSKGKEDEAGAGGAGSTGGTGGGA